MLEHHAHFLPVDVDVQLHLFPFGGNGVLFGDVHPVEEDAASGWLLQQVQAAQQGALARTGGADDHHHIPAVDVHGHIVQSLDGAVVIVFFHMLNLNQSISGHHGSFSFQNRQ